MSQSEEEPALPEYPGHTAAFGHVMRMSGLQQAQNVVKAREFDLTNLMKVRNDELVLLQRIGSDHHTPADLEVSRRMVDAEMARRNIVATVGSIRAIEELQGSIGILRKATLDASERTTDAIRSLETSVDLTTGEVSSLERTVDRLHKTTQAAGASTTAAITQLDASIADLHKTTEAGSVATTGAIMQLNTGIAELRTSTETWSRWLTRLTIGIFGLTAMLVVATLAPVWR
jgi:hypothetical protein